MQPQEIFGSYLLLHELRKDSLSTTWRAGEIVDQRGSRLCLVQLFDGEAADRTAIGAAIEQQQRLERRLASPGFGKLIDTGQIDGIPYIAYEYVSAFTFREVIDRMKALKRGAGADVALLMTERLGLSLGAAWNTADESDRLPHGFLTSHQAMVTHEGEILVTGFCSAPGARTSVVASPDRDQLGGVYQGEALFVTDYDRYLAQSVLAGEPVSPADDVYSLGAILCELLSGQPIGASHEKTRNERIANLNLNAETTEVAESIRSLLRASFGEDEPRFPNVSSWRNEVSRILDSSGHHPTTFNIAFLLHALFADEIATEGRTLHRDTTWIRTFVLDPQPAGAASSRTDPSERPARTAVPSAQSLPESPAESLPASAPQVPPGTTSATPADRAPQPATPAIAATTEGSKPVTDYRPPTPVRPATPAEADSPVAQPVSIQPLASSPLLSKPAPPATSPPAGEIVDAEAQAEHHTQTTVAEPPAVPDTTPSQERGAHAAGAAEPETSDVRPIEESSAAATPVREEPEPRRRLWFEAAPPKDAPTATTEAEPEIDESGTAGSRSEVDETLHGETVDGEPVHVETDLDTAPASTAGDGDSSAGFPNAPDPGTDEADAPGADCGDFDPSQPPAPSSIDLPAAPDMESEDPSPEEASHDGETSSSLPPLVEHYDLGFADPDATPSSGVEAGTESEPQSEVGFGTTTAPKSSQPAPSEGISRRGGHEAPNPDHDVDSNAPSRTASAVEIEPDSPDTRPSPTPQPPSAKSRPDEPETDLLGHPMPRKLSAADLLAGIATTPSSADEPEPVEDGWVESTWVEGPATAEDTSARVSASDTAQPAPTEPPPDQLAAWLDPPAEEEDRAEEAQGIEEAQKSELPQESWDAFEETPAPIGSQVVDLSQIAAGLREDDSSGVAEHGDEGTGWTDPSALPPGEIADAGAIEPPPTDAVFEDWGSAGIEASETGSDPAFTTPIVFPLPTADGETPAVVALEPPSAEPSSEASDSEEPTASASDSDSAATEPPSSEASTAKSRTPLIAAGLTALAIVAGGIYWSTQGTPSPETASSPAEATAEADPGSEAIAADAAPAPVVVPTEPAGADAAPSADAPNDADLTPDAAAELTRLIEERTQTLERELRREYERKIDELRSEMATTSATPPADELPAPIETDTSAEASIDATAEESVDEVEEATTEPLTFPSPVSPSQTPK